MGYRAPSAEDVYRYMLRVDWPSQSLTDGFGLSIVFVNDDSPVCSEFISRYFVDICHRTADRIRIIFFSDLHKSYFEDIASQMNSSSRFREGGMLSATIESALERSDEYRKELIDRFLDALRFQDYDEVDLLLSRISNSFGPRYADVLYQLICEKKFHNTPDLERQIHEIVLELQDPQRRSRRDQFHRMYEDRLRDMTPTSMFPIDAPKRTYNLSFEQKTNAAMPGIGESMRFAARFGIGNHVPCFVLFTDVGELSIDVFPIENRSAEETYKQLRNWIDSFYKENRISIDKWNQVEKDITKFTNSINQPITNLRCWRSDSDRLWARLQSTAKIITKLSSSLSNPDEYESVINNIDNPPSECQIILSRFQNRLKEISDQIVKHENKKQNIEIISIKLNSASDFIQVIGALKYAGQDRSIPERFKESNGILCKTINAIRRHRKILLAQDPKTSIFMWWQYTQTKLPSRNQFQNAYRTYLLIDINRDIGKAIYLTYNRLIEAIFDLPLLDTPQEKVRKIQILLSSTIDIPQQLVSWLSNKLMSFFHCLQDYKPVWIDSAGLNLKIADVVAFRNRVPVNFDCIFDNLEEDSLIFQAMQNAQSDWLNQKKYSEDKIQEIALSYRDKILMLFVDLPQEQFDSLSAKKLVYVECIRSLQSLYCMNKDDLVTLINSLYSYDNKIQTVDSLDIERFLNLMDEYDSAISSLIYPYKGHPSIEKIELTLTISEILQLKIPAQVNQSILIRQQITDTVKQSEGGATLLSNVQNYFAKISQQVDSLTKELGRYTNDRSEIYQEITPTLLDSLQTTTKMNILHLSDLHFGTSEQAQLWANQLAGDLKHELNISEIDAIILSGDISNRSSSGEYKAAKNFLDYLGKEFSLTSEKIIIVPGNHDVDRRITDWRIKETDLNNLAYTSKLRDRCSLEELQKDLCIEESSSRIWVRDNEKYKERFKKFSDFHESIHGKPYSLEYEEQYSVNYIPDLKTIILGLNSAWQLDHHHKDRASINMNALSNALTEIRNNPSYQDCLKIAVWHHPLDSAGNDRITDRGFMEQLAVAGFRLFLHGHIHQAETDQYRYDLSKDGRKLDRICAGTFGAPTRELVPGFPWQYNLLKFEGDRLTVETRRREQENGAWKPDARWSQGAGQDPLPRYNIQLTDEPISLKLLSDLNDPTPVPPTTPDQPKMSQTNTGSSTGFQISVSGGTVNITPPNPQH